MIIHIVIQYTDNQNLPRCRYAAASVDGATFCEYHPDETADSAARFLAAAVNHYIRLGRPVRKVVTDRARCWASEAFALQCALLGVSHETAGAATAAERAARRPARRKGRQS